MSESAEPDSDLTEDDLALLRTMEQAAQLVKDEMNQQLQRHRTARMLEGFIQAKAPRGDFSTQEALEWIDSHWMCLGCRQFYGPEDDDAFPVCDKCRPPVRPRS